MSIKEWEDNGDGPERKSTKYAAVFRPVEHSRQYCAVSQPKVEADVAAARATNIKSTPFMLSTKEFDLCGTTP